MAFISMVMERSMVTKAIRFLFSWIDFVLYWFVSVLMQAIFDIANFTLSEEIFSEVIDRVYLILGIFMLFKLTISLLSYLVNPDKISDKEKGLGKLSLRTILVLIMLIMLPTGFKLLTDLQNAILPALPKIIMGRDTHVGNRNNLADDMSNTGEEIAWSVYKAFIYDNPECVGNSSGTFTPYTDDGNPPSSMLMNAASNINLSCQNFNDGSIYQYDYTPIISTIAGGFLCYILIGVCISVAIRMFKLMILRMIAPIAIISYLDPKSSKDGAFNTWVKTLTSTWLELFVILGIIYLVIFMISELVLGSSGEIIATALSLGGLRGTFFTVFIILGLFMFAKQAPKFLMDSLGIKSKGLFGKTLGLAGSALGVIGSTVSSTGAAIKKGGLITAPSSIVKGLVSGARSASAAGSAILSTDKPTATTGIDAQRKFNDTNLANIRSGYGLGNQVKSISKRLLLGYDIDAEINNTQAIVDTSKRLKEYTMGEGAKYYSDVIQNLSYTDSRGVTHTIATSRNALQAAISRANVTGGPVTLNGQNLGSVNGSIISKLTGDTDEGVGSIYMDEVDAGNRTDNGALEAFRTSYANANGISVDVARSERIPRIKQRQKSNETKVFKLQQERGPKK